MAFALAEADLRDVLSHIDVPTLLLHGEDDALEADRAAILRLHTLLSAA